MELMFWVGLIGLMAVLVAMLIELRWGRVARRSRDRRGEWSHMAALSSMRDRAREDSRHVNASNSVQSP